MSPIFKDVCHQIAPTATCATHKPVCQRTLAVSSLPETDSGFEPICSCETFE